MNSQGHIDLNRDWGKAASGRGVNSTSTNMSGHKHSVVGTAMDIAQRQEFDLGFADLPG
jgi:hypothetical protein